MGADVKCQDFSGGWEKASSVVFQYELNILPLGMSWNMEFWLMILKTNEDRLLQLVMLGSPGNGK